ncbi:hypothetical protein KAI23_02605 [Candidatus Bathyarchaeota archaeon]|nr:hypothetical protein [Candidatus Bathyarchaeota archaeon]
MNDDKQFKNDRKDVLLAQYQACNTTRDHYDTIRWLIGSIFIGASLTIFGISFTTPLGIYEILLIAGFSITLMVIWIFYDNHVQSWIKTSYNLAHEIEEELGYLGLELHHRIRAKDDELCKTGKGKRIRNYLFYLVVIAWIIRFIMSIRL